MTETTREIFEKYEVRKTGKQKAEFRKYISGVCEKWGYNCTIENGQMGAKNIVVGDPDNAKVIFTAHYDTCPKLPFPNFITPKNIFIYVMYQILLTVLILIPVFAIQIILGIILYDVVPIEYEFEIYELIDLAVLFVVFGLFFFGPANKHTANDNTSGVTTLLDTMSKLPPEEREKVAFVFFDLEELGLWGSIGFRSNHKKSTNNKLLINFDCVSDGENALLVVKKKAREYLPQLTQAFPSTYLVNTEIVTKGAIYPSDQGNFPCGVGVCALKKSKRFGILYMDKIHTKKDTNYREENIEYFSDCAVRLAQIM